MGDQEILGESVRWANHSGQLDPRLETACPNWLAYSDRKSATLRCRHCSRQSLNDFDTGRSFGAGPQQPLMMARATPERHQRIFGVLHLASPAEIRFDIVRSNELIWGVGQTPAWCVYLAGESCWRHPWCQLAFEVPLACYLSSTSTMSFYQFPHSEPAQNDYAVTNCGGWNSMVKILKKNVFRGKLISTKQMITFAKYKQILLLQNTNKVYRYRWLLRAGQVSQFEETRAKQD